MEITPTSLSPLSIGTAINVRMPARSEERRVGKECRCRWWPYHSEKKILRITSSLAIVSRLWRSLGQTPTSAKYESDRIHFVTPCFFFSSRSRHTICYRDWSSDVCSSDLHNLFSEAKTRLRSGGRARRRLSWPGKRL